LDYYQRALEKDPRFALAYIGVADYYVRESVRHISGREAETKALSNIMKALEIDSNLAEAHTALAELKYQYEYDWTGAENDFKKAIELNPNVAATRLAYGWFLMVRARFDEAAIEMEKAREFDPSSLTINIARGRLLFYSRQYDQALQHFQKIISIEPNSPGSHLSLADIYKQKQMYPEFLEAFMTYQGLTATPPEESEALRKAFKGSGFPGFARKMLDLNKTKATTTYVSPFVFAVLNINLGRKDEAVGWLEKGFDARVPLMVRLKVDPNFDSLRDDPRFQDLLRRIGLAEILP
jgi:Tfp pilus assembly protein PilF